MSARRQPGVFFPFQRRSSRTGRGPTRKLFCIDGQKEKKGQNGQNGQNEKRKKGIHLNSPRDPDRRTTWKIILQARCFCQGGRCTQCTQSSQAVREVCCGGWWLGSSQLDFHLSEYYVQYGKQCTDPYVYCMHVHQQHHPTSQDLCDLIQVPYTWFRSGAVQIDRYYTCRYVLPTYIWLWYRIGPTRESDAPLPPCL